MIEGRLSEDMGGGFGLDEDSDDDMMNLSVSVDSGDVEGDMVTMESDALLSGNVGDSNSGAAAAQVPEALGMCGCFSVAYYRPYFDVDTADVKARLARSFMPWKRDFFELLGNRVDLYGPVWICASLVFLIGVTSNLSSWLTHPADAEPWHYDFKLLTFAASLVSTCVVLMPLIAWFAMRYIGLGASVGFLRLVTLYGYSINPFLPAAVLCGIFPSRVWNWAVVTIAFALSAVFLFSNMWGAIKESFAQQLSTGTPEGRKRLAILCVGLFGVHAAFAFILKVYFFGTYAVESGGAGAPSNADDYAGGGNSTE